MTTPVGRAEAARDLADALRTLVHGMVATEAPPELFAGVAEQVRKLATGFEPHSKRWAFDGYRDAIVVDAETLRHEYQGPFDLSPIMGRANPLAAPLRLDVEGGIVAGTATFGRAYEGMPGCVHGGVVASAFDELLGLVQVFSANPGMTGRLTIHYRSPTPLETELTLRGSVDRIEGRKTICTGEIRAGDRLCAEAEGLFIAPAPQRLAELGFTAAQQRRSSQP